MRRKGYRGVGCVKRSLSKCEGICRTYDKIQTCKINSFLMVPWLLITAPEYQKLSMESKVLYSMMFDRMSLSKKNNWKDEFGRVFIYYTVDEIIEKMGCCKQKALKLLNELKEFGLIECERIRLTKPNRIYVKTYY